MISLSPVIPNSGPGVTQFDMLTRRTTFHFGLVLVPVGAGDLVIDHDDTRTFLCERTGLVGPMSRMTVDGEGRRVLDFARFDPQREPLMPIPYVKNR